MPHQKRWPVLITSYETLRSYAKVLSKAGVDLLVCDEAGWCKTHALLKSLISALQTVI
jgi:hypothetical protein